MLEVTCIKIGLDFVGRKWIQEKVVRLVTQSHSTICHDHECIPDTRFFAIAEQDGKLTGTRLSAKISRRKSQGSAGPSIQRHVLVRPHHYRWIQKNSLIGPDNHIDELKRKHLFDLTHIHEFRRTCLFDIFHIDPAPSNNRNPSLQTSACLWGLDRQHAVLPLDVYISPESIARACARVFVGDCVTSVVFMPPHMPPKLVARRFAKDPATPQQCMNS